MKRTDFPSISHSNVTRPPDNVRSNGTELLRKAQVFNGTGFYIEDEIETGLNDLQTLFLACFATLIPLFVSLLVAFGIRVLWKRYRRRRNCKKYDGVLHTEESVESVSRPLHSHLLNIEKKCGETHLSIDTEVCNPSVNSSTQNSRGNNHSSTNGSIITMTLKNNHLIVETEERNDIEEDSRETKMKYSPSARDGVFVVEVQQGVRRSPSSGATVVCTEMERTVSVSDQCALIHNPPDRYNDDDNLIEGDENDYYAETTSLANAESPDATNLKANTGLSQSSQSLTLFSYTYGNQTEYENGAYGYQFYNGCSNDRPTTQKIQLNSKPKITSAIFKNRNNQSLSLEVLQDGPLLSDMLICGKSSSKDDDDSIQEEQNRLGNYFPNKKEILEQDIQNKLIKEPGNFNKIDNMSSSLVKTTSNGVASKSKS